MFNASTTMNSNVSNEWFSGIHVDAFLQPTVPTLNKSDIYTVSSPSHAQWQLHSAWGRSDMKGSSGLCEAVFSQGHTFNVKQWPKVFSIHHCRDFYFVCLYRRDRVKLFADDNSIQHSKDVTFKERDTSSVLFFVCLCSIKGLQLKFTLYYHVF